MELLSAMKFKFTVLLLICLPSFFAMGKSDLDQSGIDSLLEQTIQELESDETEKPVKSPARVKQEKKDEKKEGKGGNELGRPADSVSPSELNEVQARLLTILKQTDNPKAVLEGLILEGELALSPNDIYTLRAAIDVVEKAENSPLVEPTVINDEYMIDHRDRYKMYDIYVHDTGETLIEFLDATGQPWPIFDHSDGKYFDVSLGEDHMLWITPQERHRKSNFFVTLVEYSAPIQFNIQFTNEKRHGLATFKLPFISPTNSKAKKASNTSSIDLETMVASSRKGGNDGSLSENKIDLPTLSYLAATGRFRPGTEAALLAQQILVSNAKIAQVWYYKEQFVIRTQYQMYSFDNVVNSGGAMKVYVATSLNSIVQFFDGQKDISLLIPDYHNYGHGTER